MNPDSANKQNSNPSDSKLNVQWDIDRYLLSNSSLDRDAFEQRVLEDLSLAEMVATSVADLQAISSAARITLASPVTLTPRASSKKYLRGTYRWAMLVTAVGLLLAVSARQFRSVSNEDRLSLMADNWVAFEGLTTTESLELIANDEPSNENQSNMESNEQTDWLVEAAREFYLANTEGAAG